MYAQPMSPVMPPRGCGLVNGVNVSGCDCSYTDPSFLSSTCGPTLALFLGIVEMVLRGQCDIAEPCRRAQPDSFQRRGQEEYDFIVVGAGVAGSVVASRLSEDLGQSVLLLEAGPEEPVATLIPAFAVKAVGTFLDWGYETIPEKKACRKWGGICKWPRGKMVAGTGGMQGMMYVRGHPVIYDNWEKMGNYGWGYQDVLPYFLKAEGNRELHLVDKGFHADCGPMPVQRFPHRPNLATDIVRAGKEMGYYSEDLNGRNQTGFTVAQMMVHEGLRASTPRMYLRPAMGRPNLVVNTDSHVSRVIIDGDAGRATGVEFIDKQGVKRVARARKEVVVSAGAVGSPQLLLLSGLGPSEELHEVGIKAIRDLPVGRNLHNHVSATVNFLVDDMPGKRPMAAPSAQNAARFEADGVTNGQKIDEPKEEVAPITIQALHTFLQRRSGPLTSTGLTQVTAMITSKYAEQAGVPDVQIYFDGFHAGCQSELSPALRCFHKIINMTHSPGDFYDIQVDLDLDETARLVTRQRIEAASGQSAIAVEGCPMTRKLAARPTVVRPLSMGRLRLRSADPRDKPLIHGNYFDHDRDLLVLVEGMKVAAGLAKTRTLQRWGFQLDTTPVQGCQHLQFASDDYWACAAQTATGPENHQAGSCRMGPAGDPKAVVDPELRVHGIPNLRVIDASVMPIVPNANTIAGIVMIAEKGSDMIRQTWKTSRLTTKKP